MRHAAASTRNAQSRCGRSMSSGTSTCRGVLPGLDASHEGVRDVACTSALNPLLIQVLEASGMSASAFLDLLKQRVPILWHGRQEVRGMGKTGRTECGRCEHRLAAGAGVRPWASSQARARSKPALVPGMLPEESVW